MDQVNSKASPMKLARNHTKSNLSEEIGGVVGDLIIKDKEIIGIRIKPDRIEGKV